MAVPYDIVVIGGGSAGLVVASAAAQLKAKVVLVEKEPNRLGGDCLYHGCVPSKSLIHAGRVAHTVRQAGAMGVNAPIQSLDFAKAIAHVQAVISTIAVHDSTERFTDLGVEVVYGSGQFRDRTTFSVNGRDLQARAFVIATGSHPFVPNIPGLTEAGYLTNMQVFSLKTLPPRLLVVGGGPIGCELGQAFARLGSAVTLVASHEHLLHKEDPEAAAVVEAQFAREGIRVLTQCRLESVEVRGGDKIATVNGKAIAVDAILLATGRQPNVQGLGLEAAGVTVTTTGIQVNDKLQTTNPRIYAAGDVTGGYLFTHMAGYEASVVLKNALFFSTSKADYRVVPWATFTEPELARVGLTESEARAQYGADVYVLKQAFDHVDRALAEGAEQGFGKIICRGDGTILGAHYVGANAGDLIHEVVLAMTYRLKVTTLSGFTHIYPTLAEVNSKVGLQLTKQKYAKNGRLQGILRRFFQLRRWLAS